MGLGQSFGGPRKDSGGPCAARVAAMKAGKSSEGLGFQVES